MRGKGNRLPLYGNFEWWGKALFWVGNYIPFHTSHVVNLKHLQNQVAGPGGSDDRDIQASDLH